VSTLVLLHAHPDDESLATGGTMARAAAEGHRVVLVVATGGEHGEQPADLAPGETLRDRRRRETEASCAALGVHRLEWLGYEDSGMTGWEQNANAAAFMNAPLDEAAGRLASILTEESADVLVTYDWHGNYGHPDHIAAHRVGHRAAELAGTPRVFEVTLNRDHFRALRAATTSESGEPGEGWGDFDPDAPADDGNPVGEPESAISHRVDVGAYAEQKLRAITSHASQVTDISFFETMDPAVFATLFGLEWFIEVGSSGPPRDAWLFD